MNLDYTSASSIPVLIVGGGIVGLSAALFLAWRGVPTVLVERHAGSSLHPRAMGFTTRTMELYRAVGLGQQIPQVPPGFGRPRRVKVESLAGAWASEDIAWTPGTPDVTAGGKPSEPPEYSICTGAAIPQDRLEPILRAKAIELGADIRASTTLLSFAQDENGVTARMRQRDGKEYTLQADYMIAADGHSSSIRAQLGISRDGRGLLRTIRSVLFRASLEQYLESGISQFEIQQPDFTAMLTTYRDGRWLLMFADDEDRDESTLRAMIDKATGRPDLEVEIITTGRWELSALIAERFVSGRVFLAGDSAHTLPPARGGYGANTGIEDAHNLAWKLAAVLGRVSAPALLDTYDVERRPIAWLRHGQIFARPDYAQFARPTDKAVPIISDDAMEFGQLYRSAAVCGADGNLPPALLPDEWAGQPGTRAPHAWVLHGGRRVSTLDLVQPDWVLLTQDQRWLATAQQVSDRVGIKVQSRLLGSSQITDAVLASAESGLATVPGGATPFDPVDPNAFCKAFGIGSRGASLIRPDGYIAWRSIDMPANPVDALADVLAQVSFATPRC